MSTLYSDADNIIPVNFADPWDYDQRDLDGYDVGDGWSNADFVPVHSFVVELNAAYPKRRGVLDRFTTYLAVVIAGWLVCALAAHFLASLAHP